MRSYSPFSRTSWVVKWLFIRLPRAFSIPLIIISFVWMFHGFDYINKPIAQRLEDAVTMTAKFVLPELVGQHAVDLLKLKNLDDFVRALIVTFMFLAGFAVAYNLAFVVNWLAVLLK